MTFADTLLIALLSLVWGGSYFFIRIAVPAFGPTTLVVARVVIGGALLWGVARVRRQPLELRPIAGRLAILGLLNAALPYGLIAAAELRLTASLAAVLTATAPLFAALFAARFLGESLTMRRIGGMLVGVAGVGIIVGWSPIALTPATMLAIAAMLVSSACYAGAGIYARLKLSGVPTHTLALGQQLGAFVWLAVPGVIFAPRTLPAPAAIWSVIALGVLSTALAYSLYFHLLERMGPTKIATIAYLLPVAGLLWGALFLHEPVTPGMFGGLALVFGSVIVINRERGNANARRVAAGPAVRGDVAPVHRRGPRGGGLGLSRRVAAGAPDAAASPPVR